MSDTEKRIEEEANEEANKGWKWAENYLKQKHPAIAYEYGVKAGFKLGAHFGIQLGKDTRLEEVLEYLRSEEAMKMDNAFAERNDCMMDRCLWVKELESKFKGIEASEGRGDV